MIWRLILNLVLHVIMYVLNIIFANEITTPWVIAQFIFLIVIHWIFWTKLFKDIDNDSEVIEIG